MCRFGQFAAGFDPGEEGKPPFSKSKKLLDFTNGSPLGARELFESDAWSTGSNLNSDLDDILSGETTPTVISKKWSDTDVRMAIQWLQREMLNAFKAGVGENRPDFSAEIYLPPPNGDAKKQQRQSGKSAFQETSCTGSRSALHVYSLPETESSISDHFTVWFQPLSCPAAAIIDDRLYLGGDDRLVRRFRAASD